MHSKQDYAAQLNTVFKIEHDQGTVELTLIEVSSVTAEAVESGQSEPFSAVFRSNSQDVFGQGSYTLNHATEGDLLVFLVPIGPDEQGMCYEAVFT